MYAGFVSYTLRRWHRIACFQLILVDFLRAEAATAFSVS